MSDLEFSLLTLRELAKRTSNECFAADAKTRQIVAQNVTIEVILQAAKGREHLGPGPPSAP